MRDFPSILPENHKGYHEGREFKEDVGLSSQHNLLMGSYKHDPLLSNLSRYLPNK